jgi:tetratricopeptide (TPR) repeat protein
VFFWDFDFANTTPEENDSHKELTIGGYPPAWLRLERVERAIEGQILARPPSSDSADFAEIADALIANAPIVWRAVEPRLPTLIDLVRLQNNGRLTDTELAKAKAQTGAIPISYETEQFLPGCYVRVSWWISSFLCNSDLQSALVMFEAGQNDEAVIVAYRAAISQDWLLLSGVQAEWAQTALTGDSGELRKHASAILALTGDKENLKILRAVDTRSWSEADRSQIARAQQFLELHGHDVSVSRLTALAPQDFKLEQFLSFPGDSTELLKFIPRPSSTKWRQFLQKYSSVTNLGSLSSLMVALAYGQSRGGDIDGILADLLHALSLNDAALQYAAYGISAGGNLASLENSMGVILTSKHDYANANIHYSASLAAGRNDGWPELNIANNLNRIGNLDDAEKMYRKALSRQNNVRNLAEYAEYLNDTAWFLVTKRSSDHSKLQEAYKLSIQSNTITEMKDPNFLDTLAQCQLQLGDKSGAKSVLATAQKCRWLRISEDGSITLTERGEDLRRLGAAEACLREQLFDVLLVEAPPWSRRMIQGRYEALKAMPDDARQCFQDCGLAEGTADDIVAWWDRATGSLRTERSKVLNEIGRRAERFSLQFERARTGKEPIWQGLETAVSGYDVLSVIDTASDKRLKIEVKGSSMKKSEASFFVSRNEWNTASTSPAYHFHLWLVRDDPRLFVVPAQNVLPHIPADQGSGKWQGAELYFREFGAYEQPVASSKVPLRDAG